METHRPPTRRPAALLCALVAGAVCLGGLQPAAATPRPTGDLMERFFADPRADSAWHGSGAWTWDAATTALVAGGTGEFLRTGASHFAGTIAVRVKLPAGGGGPAPAARVIFAFDPASGAHRWLEIRAGSPGRLVLGQTGSLRGSAEGAIQSWRTAVPAGVWQDVGVRVAGNKSVAVTLGAKTLFTAAAAPLVPGLIGFASLSDGVAFDSFSFTADPDGEPCRECHAGQPEEPLAANVYTYWDGRWWNTTWGGSPSSQQGGHGDPGGRSATTCAGVRGCHDLRLPSPGDHRNGVREGRPSRGAQRSVNAYHLRSGFIATNPRYPWSAQVTFDNYCYTACHPAANRRNMRHEQDTLPTDANYRSVQLGTHLTAVDGESMQIFVDSDLTSRATPAEPDFVPCVGCHDPHGTGAAVEVANPGNATNRMLRRWSKDPYFCSGATGCHL